MHMLLQDKVAVIYGAGGAIGGAVASAFEAAGATVLATTHAELDALDERAIERHLDSVGRVDISFNAIGLPNDQMLGTPLLDLELERFARPIAAYTTSYFLTARAAARRMIPNGSGVIMNVSAPPARQGSWLNGGYGPAQAANEALTRDLSYELAPQGIRVVTLRPHGLPESDTMREIYDVKAKDAMSWEQFQANLAGSTHRRRTMTLAEVGDAAVLVASDRAGGLTGTTVNLTLGSTAD
jgi:NAD(P)-dependent dehydrogenase (short-subunit alcohol dehydrogenase family)